MTDMNRRGFLALLGAAGAVAAMPRAALAALEAPPPDLMRLHSGLWARANGVVRWLGNIESTAIAAQRDAVEVTPRYSFHRQWTPGIWQPPEATFELHITEDSVRGLHWLQKHVETCYANPTASPYCDLIAVMRTRGAGTDPNAEWRTVHTDDAVALRVRDGDFVLASRGAFLTEWQTEIDLRGSAHRARVDFRLGQTTETGHVAGGLTLHNPTPDALLTRVLQLEPPR